MRLRDGFVSELLNTSYGRRKFDVAQYLQYNIVHLMKRLHRPSIRISQLKTLRISKASIFIVSVSLLVVLSAGVYIRHDNAAERSAKQQQTSSTITKAAPVTSKPAKTVPVSTPGSTTPATATTATPPPMNRPGNRYTDESSAGPLS